MVSTRSGLTRTELRTWRRFTSGVSALLEALDRQLRDDSGLSLDDFEVLRPLWATPDSALRMSDLADQLSYSPSRLSHAVQRMEDKGWVEKESSPDDRRVRMVRLTSAGNRLFADAWPGHSQMIRELLLTQLDDHERQVFEDTFSKIRRSARHSHPRS